MVVTGLTSLWVRKTFIICIKLMINCKTFTFNKVSNYVSLRNHFTQFAKFFNTFIRWSYETVLSSGCNLAFNMQLNSCNSNSCNSKDHLNWTTSSVPSEFTSKPLQENSFNSNSHNSKNYLDQTNFWPLDVFFIV